MGYGGEFGVFTYQCGADLGPFDGVTRLFIFAIVLEDEAVLLARTRGVGRTERSGELFHQVIGVASGVDDRTPCFPSACDGVEGGEEHHREQA